MEKNQKAALQRRKNTIAKLVTQMRTAQLRAADSPFTFPDIVLGDDAMGNYKDDFEARRTSLRGYGGIWRGGC